MAGQKPIRRKKARATKARSRRRKAIAPEETFAALLSRHIRETGIRKVALARAMGTKPQYVREIETGRKPPPTLDKVEALSEALGLADEAREQLLARAREGRTRPESRDYFRNLEDAFRQLTDVFALDAGARERVRQGDFEHLVDQIREAFLTAGKVKSETEFVPFLQVMRYSTFVKQLLDGFDALNAKHDRNDIRWVQTEILGLMEKLVGLREGEARISRRLEGKGGRRRTGAARKKRRPRS